ncbi:MAG: amidohydrolase family protein [Parvibaculum sp.]|nr:amidohydrolase family protein [Parvibaculum sp.]MBX3494196.1 amidohydrolase family protein [Parvibaculum sp.]
MSILFQLRRQVPIEQRFQMSDLPRTFPPNFNPRPPREPLPAGACDCHFHVFGPESRFPYMENRTYTPADSGIDAYMAICDRIGIDRAVLVQASVYGLDNSALLNALRAYPARLRAVAVVRADTTDSELQLLHDAGVRGIRINPRFPDALTLPQMLSFAERLKDMRWHIQLIADAEMLSALEVLAPRMPVPLVLDHLGHVPQALAADSASLRSLMNLAGSETVWVKLSAPYLLSQDRPAYRNTVWLQRALASIAPDRLLWGSNWPHPGMSPPMPEEGELLDLLAEAVPDTAQRRAILVDNPARLYGFQPR